ncbi:transposase [Endozoicomonas sp. SM1973]|uniref:Transposase n=1 Tax=Spartinivicinus marinus TaxID=2994442 RepID=A0A853I9K5_9GAMM|nr:transposase [Spartinivicinus marinus]MCX4025324.1 transposase [Spartinivicinus marinus]NYZ69973.1 transposase [Spartinivicinus marinus]
MTKKKKTYTQEFKQGAVQLVVEQQMKPSEVAHRLGTSDKNISRWVKEYKMNTSKSPEHESTLSEYKTKIKALEKENKRLQMEREILKNCPHSLLFPI